MMKFYGYELELFAGEVIGEVDGVSVRAGTDFCGGHWLIVRVGDDPEHLVWVSAPVSQRTLHEVASGNAAVRDVLRHSVTDASTSWRWSTAAPCPIDACSAPTFRLRSCRPVTSGWWWPPDQADTARWPPASYWRKSRTSVVTISS